MSPVWPDHAWLPLAVPVGARGFLVGDRRLRQTLAACGAELVERGGDVEIADAKTIRGETACAVTALGAKPPDRGPLPVRRATRAARAVALQARAVRSRAVLRRSGYHSVSSFAWEPERAYVPWLVGGRRALADLFPTNVVVVASQARRPTPTLFEACLDAARIAVALDAGTDEVLLRESTVVAPAGEGVLRVGLGPGGEAIAAQTQALAALASRPQRDAVRALVPWVLAHGTESLATWSLEKRLGGRVASGSLNAARTRACLEFLTLLHGTACPGAGAPPLAERVRTVAAACPAARAGALERVGAWIGDRLQGFPTVFGHGDFFAGNLLFERDELVGVLDWEQAGEDHLALADVLHLQIAGDRAHGRRSYGEVVVEEALPRALAGGGELVEAYCARMGIPVDRGRLAALVGVCWLSWLAHELARLADRSADREWMRRNVDDVAEAFTAMANSDG